MHSLQAMFTHSLKANFTCFHLLSSISNTITLTITTAMPSHLDRKVDDLVRKYSKIPSPRPVLRDVLNRPEQSSLLLDAIARQVSLIRCRSQAFDDGQVTVYDRALLALSRDGRDLVHTGALELYLTEYLGLVPFCGAESVEDAVAKHVGLQRGLNQRCSSLPLLPLWSRLTRCSSFEIGARKY